jgi:hypothetical protein
MVLSRHTSTDACPFASIHLSSMSPQKLAMTPVTNWTTRARPKIGARAARDLATPVGVADDVGNQHVFEAFEVTGLRCVQERGQQTTMLGLTGAMCPAEMRFRARATS